jgi:hypothetical protein
LVASARAASAFRLAFPRLTWSQISFPSQCAGNPQISLPIRQFASKNAVFKYASRDKPEAWALDFLAVDWPTDLTPRGDRV